MQKKTLFFVLAILCLLVAGWAYYQYQKPREGVVNVEADYTITAAQLYKAFAQDEAAAAKQYVDKVVRVQGAVQQIDSLQGDVNLILASNAAEGGINCTLADVGKVPAVGSMVTVKGRCVGFLMDVSLIDAVIDHQ